MIQRYLLVLRLSVVHLRKSVSPQDLPHNVFVREVIPEIILRNVEISMNVLN